MNFKIESRTDSKRKDGLHQFRLKVGTGDSRKFIPLKIYANTYYWDNTQEAFIIERGSAKEIKERNALYEAYNSLISKVKDKCKDIMRDFERTNIIPTPTQFIEKYTQDIGINSKITPYFENRVKALQETGHIGNSICYSRTLYMLRLFDSKFDKLFFNDITLRYVNRFDEWLEKRGCNGNTRKYYHKALRALLNSAEKEKVTDGHAYPYGKGGFAVGDLEEITSKRYLPIEVMQRIKTTELEDTILETARRIFVAQYLCCGISWVDAGTLQSSQIVTMNNGRFIVYKRQKTKNAKRVTPITIHITEELQGHFDWFAANCALVGNHIFPIVTKEGYDGEKLYNHLRSRFVRNNKILKELAQVFDITDMALTSYVSRHTAAMTMQDKGVAREKISQALGHSDLATTQVYLDSFNAEALAEATKVL